MSQDRPARFTAAWEHTYSSEEVGNLWQEDPIPILPDILDWVRINKCEKIIDLGCGDGRNLRSIVEAGFFPLGIDVSPSALSRARQLVSSQCYLLQSNAESLNLCDSSIDAVLCLDVFGQVPEPQAVLGEIIRVLAPSGILALNAFTHEDSEYGCGTEIAPNTFEYNGTLFRFYDELTLRTELHNAGLRIETLYRKTWQDPPHGHFRPYEHTHDNYVVFARPN